MPGLAGEVANLIVALRLDDSGFTGKLNAVARNLRGLDSGLNQMGRGVSQVGSGVARLATVASAAAAGGLAAVVTTAASMEEAFIGVQKTVDETATFSFEELRDVIRKMSSETGTAFEELSRIGEIGGALGVGIDSLDEFIDVVNRLSVSTDLSAEDASTALGHLGTVLQLTGEDYRDLADGLVALGNAGASSEAQIVAIAERFAVAGKRAGLSTSEILALGSAVASMGIEVEAGGTALSNTFNQIAVAIGTGGKEVKAFTDLLGINAAEFRRRWEQDALGTFQEFLREVDKLPAIEQAVALEAAGITGARQQAAVGALADGYQELGRQLLVVEDREGALNEESDKFFASSAAGFRKLRENLRLSAAVIGDQLLPVVNELITDFVEFLMKPDTQAALKSFGEDLSAGIRGFVSELKGTDFSGLLSGMKFAADAAKVAFDAFRSLPAPLQAAIVGLVALNKVSGGGVGLLASGIGNILGGGLKGGLAGIFGGRGASPANPLWVQSVGGIGGTPGTGGKPGGLKLPPWVPGVGGLGLGTAGGIAALPVLLSGSEAGMGTQIDMLVQRLQKGVPIEKATEGITLGAINALLADPSLQVGIPDSVLQQLDALDGKLGDFATALDRATVAATPLGQFNPANMGGTQQSPMAAFLNRFRTGGLAALFPNKPSLPNTATDAGGGVVNLPDTALSPLTGPLSTIAANTTKLPPILTVAQLTANRVNEARTAVGRGFTALGGPIRNLTSQSSQQTAEVRRTTEAARGIASRVSEQRSAIDRGFASQGGYLSRIAAKSFSPVVNLTNITHVKISTTALQTQITRARIATGTIPEFA